MILGYPPHCTHALQWLDVICFARMKETWKQVIIDFEALHWAKVTKADFAGLFDKVYQIAFTKETIEAAFCITGVYPFDCSVITKKQMWPNETTLVKGVFTITYTRPIQAIVTTFWSHQPTTFDASPSHVYSPPPQPLAAEPGPLLLASDRHTSTHITDTPQPSPKRPLPSNWPFSSDSWDSLKKLQTLTAGLAGMQSGSFLVSHVKSTSLTPFPQLADHITHPNYSPSTQLECYSNTSQYFVSVKVSTQEAYWLTHRGAP